MRGLAVVTTCISLVCASAATKARAEAETPAKPAAGFGQRGSFLVAVDNVFGYEVEKIGPNDSGRANAGSFPGLFGPRLGLHGAFASGVTLGSNMGFSILHAGSRGSGDGSSLMAFQVSPRLGYAGSASSAFGFWFRAGPSLRLLVPEGESTALVGVGGELFLVATPADHFGVMFGPTCDVGVAGDEDSSRYTTYGLSLGLVADL